MTVLSVGRFAGSGLGHAPKRPKILSACESQDSPKKKPETGPAFVFVAMC